LHLGLISMGPVSALVFHSREKMSDETTFGDLGVFDQVLRN
jgi:hypothetical protein